MDIRLVLSSFIKILLFYFLLKQEKFMYKALVREESSWVMAIKTEIYQIMSC
ncbi:hypothetical protein BMS3Bbin05_00179 [bacterium BMS3Bbin05]|nr:hypothetical protein BMS3Bbin05_00179 [bacterium BMS3Bbin05]